jgi:RNA polymerase sigma factor (sigma-70 family)
MTPKAGPPVERGPVSDYCRLAAILASRAARLGSQDPESAAQETIRRSLENPKSRPAIEYYLGDFPAVAQPEWPLEQLLAWLHGVLRYVVREERSRASFHQEVRVRSMSEPVDASPDMLQRLVERETRAIVSDCFAALDGDYRRVLELRLDGMKYAEIAQRLRLNENTVATWVSRGIRELGRRIRNKVGGSHE